MLFLGLLEWVVIVATCYFFIGFDPVARWVIPLVEWLESKSHA